MKTYKLRAFGITKDILGGKELLIQADASTVGDLRGVLKEKYPELTALKSLMVAVNSTYAEDSQPLLETDEIALIPPVSGG
jgi:sulfur-carrier protein